MVRLMSEFPRWNKLIREIKNEPGKEGDGGNLREKLIDTKKAEKRGDIFGRDGTKQAR